MKKQNEELIPPTEDLMREHGVLNRVLLIYEEIISRIEQDTIPITSLAKALDIIQTFIENYHEKLEETYIFPLFEEKKLNLRLIKTLRVQHTKGREITAQLKEICTSTQAPDPKIQKIIKGLLKKFITMYRPHEAREDTVLFPQVRSLLTDKDFKELGKKFENLEHRLFGQEGFHVIVRRVEDIEKELGIYRLEQFTPVIS